MERQGLRQAELFLRGAAAKAWTAVRERRLPLSPVWWVRALALHWQDVRTAARVGNDRLGDDPRTLDQNRLELSYRQWLQSRRATVETFTAGPAAVQTSKHLTVVALVNGTSSLCRLVESVRAQRFEGWDLWLVVPDDLLPAADLAVQPVVSGRRIAAITLGELMRSDGTWLPPGHGEYVVFLDADTRLAPGALGFVAATIAAADHTIDWIYTDDDRLDEDGRRLDPNLKGGFSPELALADDYATRLAVARRGAVERAGGLRRDAGDAQIYDVLLRVVASGGRIHHLAEVACHRSGAVPAVLGPQHRAAAERILAARGVPARIGIAPHRSSSAFDRQDIAWPHDMLVNWRVTIVIPTRDRVDLLARCIQSLRRTVDPERVRLLVVDDESIDEATRSYLTALESDRDLRCRVIRQVRTDGRFSYARLMNAASREVDTDLMLHLNDDIEALTPGWLDRMSGWLSFDDIGVVGAKLLYPNGSIQHAGVVVSPRLGAPGHLFTGLTDDDMGYQWLPHRVRNVSAVTGACLLTRTALYLELGGFDEEHLAVQFNDTDFCLRAIGAGKRVVYEPAAVLLHHESASRGRSYDYRETLYFLEKYRDYRDPFASPWLDPASVYGPTPLVAS